MKVYVYQKCSTCRNALKWLEEKGYKPEVAAIRETPPTVDELRLALAAKNGEIRRLFNTSGMDYRDLGMKDKLPGLSEQEALKLLSSNGNLVKRPLLFHGSVILNGFTEKEWAAALADGD
jgi:arsenate reductase (glutaredoxin)